MASFALVNKLKLEHLPADY